MRIKRGRCHWRNIVAGGRRWRSVSRPWSGNGSNWRHKWTKHQAVTQVMTSIEGFCERVQRGLAQATFAQRRQLVELLIDRVIVTNGDVEIRYVIPTSPASVHMSALVICVQTTYYYLRHWRLRWHLGAHPCHAATARAAAPGAGSPAERGQWIANRSRPPASAACAAMTAPRNSSDASAIC